MLSCSDTKEESLIAAYDKLTKKDKTLELYSSLTSKLEQWETINNNIEEQNIICYVKNMEEQQWNISII